MTTVILHISMSAQADKILEDSLKARINQVMIETLLEVLPLGTRYQDIIVTGNIIRSTEEEKKVSLTLHIPQAIWRTKDAIAKWLKASLEVDLDQRESDTQLAQFLASPFVGPAENWEIVILQQE